MSGPPEPAPSVAPDTSPDPALATRPREDEGDLTVEGWITLGVVLACVVFTFVQLQPELIFRATTPNGGDMGAHVWAPAYLRDHLLPDLRLTGWTNDWYAGFPALRFYMVPPMLAIVLLDVVLPYGVAFKLVAISGVLALPVACWAFAHLAGLRFPSPALFSVGATLFLFNREYSIWGGNIPSTLAGEFSFTISLALAILYLGLVANGLRTGRHRVAAAIVVGLCGLTHVIPLIFAIVGTALLLACFPSRRSLLWLATTAPVGALLAAWWLLPFWWQSSHLNDMAWSKTEPPTDAGAWERAGFYLTAVFPRGMRWSAHLALIGVVVGTIRRIRVVWAMAAIVLVVLVAYIHLPQGRLWNARILPFAYLVTFLLAAFAIGEGARWLAEGRRARTRMPLRIGAALAATAVAVVVMALPLRSLPFGSTADDGTYSWLGLETTDSSYIPGWARWNFRGYEGKDAWPEYEDVLLTMEGLGETNGCGRAMWEYERELDRYGTPMALMLLPYWTDGCIASMEGLYFESATTTPFHFLNQSVLSTAPSRAQRGLPYRDFDVDLGVAQLQLMGVRYYMALSEPAIAAASRHPDLDEVARSGPWVVYEVADAPLVESMTHLPNVLEPEPEDNEAWIHATARWFLDPPAWDVHLAGSGPESWPRVDVGGTPTRVPVAPVEVSDIELDDDRISFDVSEPGVPVLVKVSHFPNWQVEGADGPWRVSPSFMVVVPTDTHVELSYGRAPVEVAGWGLTVLGLLGLVLLVRAGPLDPDAPDLDPSGRPDGGDPEPARSPDWSWPDVDPSGSSADSWWDRPARTDSGA